MKKKYQDYKQMYEELKDKYDLIQMFNPETGENKVHIVHKGTPQILSVFDRQKDSSYEKIEVDYDLIPYEAMQKMAKAKEAIQDAKKEEDK